MKMLAFAIDIHNFVPPLVDWLSSNGVYILNKWLKIKKF